MAKYFSFRELIESETAKYYGQYNVPNSLEIYRNLDNLMTKVLDPAREKLGQPIIITSGFRSGVVNSLVHGNINSQHMKGEAADIKPQHSWDMLKLWRIITEELPEFDQAIYYVKRGFIHVSIKRGVGNRKEILYNHEP